MRWLHANMLYMVHNKTVKHYVKLLNAFVMPETKEKPEKLTKQKKLKGRKEKPKGTIITVTPHGGTIHPSLSSSSASTQSPDSVTTASLTTTIHSTLSSSSVSTQSLDLVTTPSLTMPSSTSLTIPSLLTSSTVPSVSVTSSTTAQSTAASSPFRMTIDDFSSSSSSSTEGSSMDMSEVDKTGTKITMPFTICIDVSSV